MLTELIAATQRSADENGNGSGNGVVAELVDEAEDEDDEDVGLVDEEPEPPTFEGEDPGASRRYRFRHPTASGKTIAAAGFVERNGPACPSMVLYQLVYQSFAAAASM